MDGERVDAWLGGSRRAWEQADPPAVLGLFTAGASYRSHPLRPDGDRVAVEWWTTMTAGGAPATLAGCLLLAFAGDGRCRDLRECWHEAEERIDPPADWGRLDPDPGRPRPRARPPLGRGLRTGLAGRRPGGRGRPVRPRHPLPLRALPRPPPGVARASWPTPATPMPPRPTSSPASAPRSPPAPRPRWPCPGRPGAPQSRRRRSRADAVGRLGVGPVPPAG